MRTHSLPREQRKHYRRAARKLARLARDWPACALRQLRLRLRRRARDAALTARARLSLSRVMALAVHGILAPTPATIGRLREWCGLPPEEHQP